MSNFVERIKMLMSEKRIRTVRQLAEEIAIPESTIGRQLNGERSINIETIGAILNTYTDISAEWLMRGEGQMLKAEQEEQLPVKKKPLYETILEGLCNESEETLEDIRSVFNTVMKIRKRNNQ